MVDKKSILDLENFINSGAFKLMPQNTQQELLSNLASMKEEEKSELKNEIIDKIKEKIISLLENEDIELSLNITYHKGVLTVEEKDVHNRQLSVVQGIESKTEEQKDNVRTQSKSIGFSVLFPDGKVIQKNKAKLTFINSLNYIGLKRIVESNFEKKFAGYDLIGKVERTDMPNCQFKVGEWLVYTFMDNEQKMSVLMQLSEHLNLGLKIKLDDGKDYVYTSINQSTNVQALKVIFPDGTEICDKQAVMTMAHAIEKIGFERVANRHNQKKYSGFNLVGRKKRTENGVKWQQEIDGWFIFTYMNNIRKAQVLDELSLELNLGLKVYVEGELITGKIKQPNIDSLQDDEIKSTHDRTKFSLNGGEFLNKRKFAWKVVRTYVDEHPTVTYKELQKIFPNEFTTKRLGVVRSVIDMPQDMPESEYPQRYMMKDEELIELSDGDIITVCSQWNPERLANMTKLAESLGWKVTRSLDGVVIGEGGSDENSYIIQEELASSVTEDTDDTFGVRFADGTYIEGNNAMDTFISTLKLIGLSRIPDVGIVYDNINLVTVIQKDASRQTNIDGVYVYTHLTREQMMDAIRKISDCYYMDLEIEK